VTPGAHDITTTLKQGFCPERLCCPNIPGVEVFTIDEIVVDGRRTSIKRPATDFLETCQGIPLSLGRAPAGGKITVRMTASARAPRFMAVLFGSP
jgi:hypothetical protein